MHRKTQGTSVEISPLCFNMPLKGNISVRHQRKFVFVRNMANVQALKLVVSLWLFLLRFPSLQVTSLSWQQSSIWISQCRTNLQCSEVTTSGWSLLSLCFSTLRKGEKPLKLRRITWYSQRIFLWLPPIISQWNYLCGLLPRQHLTYFGVLLTGDELDRWFGTTSAVCHALS